MVLWILAPRAVSAIALCGAVLAVALSTSLPEPLLWTIAVLCAAGLVVALVVQGMAFKRDFDIFW